MAEEFKIGDIVQLKSGGPKMTVVSAPEGGKVWASWFAGAKSERAFYPMAALQVPPEDPKKV